MRNKLLIFSLLFFPVQCMFANTVSLEEVKLGNDERDHSEIPVDVNVDGTQMSILILEYVDEMDVTIDGQGVSSMMEIDYAAPGEVYEIDMSQYSSGCYDINIHMNTGEILSGEFEL